jgi:hypothetical protein
VIRIRYSSELQPGLNGHAARLDRATVVYLLPGLTPAERAATLRRLHQHGRMGIGPALPRWQLGLALLADRVRTAFGQAGAIVRTHPAGSTLPVMAVSAAVAGFLVLSAVSIRIVHTPIAAGSGTAGVGQGHAASGAVPGAQARGQRGTGQPGRPGQPGQPGTAPASSPAPGASGTGSGPGAPTPAPGSASTGPVTLSSAAATTAPPSSLQSPAPAPSASPASTSPSAAASPATSAGSTTRVCVSIGPFGVCLGL